VVEAVEHLFRHQIFTSFRLAQGGPDGRDLSR
jgi:hypothetical protein